MRILACSLALGVAVATPVHARPPAAPAAPKIPETEVDRVNAAIQAWSSGNWARVRALLEPLVQDDRELDDPLLEEAALRYLADATLQDPDVAAFSLEWSTAYIQRLLASADWRPPADTHSKAFYDLYNSLREERDRAAANQCKAERAACTADLDELNVRHDKLRHDHELLRRAYEQQEVEVVEKVARNRAVALIPFGVGHFYNGRMGIGAAFVASEVVFGVAGLSLLIARLLKCDRSAGYQPGSVTCVNAGSRELVALRRNAESAMGWAFLGSVALDIVLAQVLFRPYVTLKKSRVRRSDLAVDDDDEGGLNRPGPRPRTRPGAPSSRLRSRDILRLSPAPALIPGGAGFGVKLRF